MAASRARAPRMPWQGRDGALVIIDLIGALNDQNGIDRSAGFREGIGSLENAKLTEVPTDWDSARALSGLQNAFQANPDAVAVLAATDPHFPAVETVLTDLGRRVPAGEPGHVGLTGVNGSRDGYDAVVAGSADAFVVMGTDATGRTAVDLVAKIPAGEEADRLNHAGCNRHTADSAVAAASIIQGALKSSVATTPETPEPGCFACYFRGSEP